VDNCDENVAINFAEETRTGNCETSYQIVRSWTATDNCGNHTVMEQEILVGDFTSISVVHAPTDMTVACHEIPAPAILDFANNCDGDIVLDFEEIIQPGSCTGSYAIERHWTATNDCGAEHNIVQTITVVDNESPILYGVPDDITVTCDDMPALPFVSAEDDCSGAVTPTFSETSFYAGCGEHFVQSWIAVDDCGNRTTASRTIFVEDVEAPVFLSTPEDVYLDCDGAISVETPEAADNCSDVKIFFEDEKQAGDCTTGYEIIRTWTAVDECGNTTSITSRIIIRPEDNKPGETGPCVVFPNPFIDVVKVNFYVQEDGTPVNLSVVNMLGQRLVSHQQLWDKGKHEFDFNLSVLSIGTYVLIVEHGEEICSQKIVKYK